MTASSSATTDARPVPVILADEPTSRVDRGSSSGMFAGIAHEHGTTFVCATHDPVLIAFADDELKVRATAPVRLA